VPGDAAYLDMMDAYEHAVGLGGSSESRLAFSTGECWRPFSVVSPLLETKLAVTVCSVGKASRLGCVCVCVCVCVCDQSSTSVYYIKSLPHFFGLACMT
jgi:hypothetical protein